eukprot:1045081_1
MARLSAFLLTTMTLHIELILCTQYRNGDVSSPFIFYLDDYILSHGGLARLMLQGGDGNLVMRQYASSSWSYGGWATGTDPNGDHVELQEDGGLVVFDATGGVLWQSNSIAGTAPFRLIVTDDVETYILDSSDKIVWSTNPSFARFEAVWTETFNSNDMGWTGGDLLTFSSTSLHCPNYPDVCLKLPWQNLAGDSRAWAEIYDTDTSMYSALQLQVDITGYDLQGTDACEIWWSFGAPSWNMYKTRYPSGVFKDIIIDIPLPTSFTSIYIDLTIQGNSPSDQCYFDNAILRGILPSESPTEATPSPSNQPSTQPSTHPSSFPTQIPSTATPTEMPSSNPSEHPTVSPSSFSIQASPTDRPSTTPSTAIHEGEVSEESPQSSMSPQSEASEETLSFGRIVSLVLWILVILIAVGFVKLCCYVSSKRTMARAHTDLDQITNGDDKQDVTMDAQDEQMEDGEDSIESLYVNTSKPTPQQQSTVSDDLDHIEKCDENGKDKRDSIESLYDTPIHTNQPQTTTCGETTIRTGKGENNVIGNGTTCDTKQSIA